MAGLGGTDFIEAGSGPKVILIHSSVAGARQWGNLMSALSDKFHLIAINLFGYGATDGWPKSETQTLEDQARLLQPFLPDDGEKVSIVGHSYGGSVAMKAAALFKDHIDRLVLIEPNPFYLLEQNGRDVAFQEATSLRNTIKQSGKDNTWPIAAEVFANYWTGQGSWDAMPEERRAKFTKALEPNFHEWDGVMNEKTPLSDWEAQLPSNTTVVSAADTVRSIDEIVSLMRENIPHWRFEMIERGGHMAAMTKPDLMNPIIERALER
ncbi:alpha/beta fold hydrolase [Leisingera aquaemixtae]|uniref:4,5:9,10-diseco-3-hydroxy-5,9, 17-trioxoandrosta-1(10),2-diene-4-oate hydrolase n=1 Tax=Leisingera aquaemixtae TaxID=1396826 RepID=A0A0P1H9K2_9RHOB|nr:alpha/beta hydrolase [Leisingera aquaemixtae]CUH99833.1 4,5:9,10-diseco-3-hydroxy-5,9, 17-trioxoandrosta-1(10),2-diene-4-oate hydrolase [Leisingera aquaemixtae]